MEAIGYSFLGELLIEKNQNGLENQRITIIYSKVKIKMFLGGQGILVQL